MDLTIIIVSWNVQEKLRENLKALQTSKGDFDYEIFVVDNNSEDDTVDMVKREFPDVHLVENYANFGFAKANNQVLKQMESEFVLLLNPDMRVAPDTLMNMINWMRTHKSASVATGRLVDIAGKIVTNVRRWPTFFDQLAIILKLPHLFPHLLDRYLAADFDYADSAQVDSIRGSFMMLNLPRLKDLPHSLDNTLPQLDERYFIWFEDVDYCRQVKKAGGEVWYTPDALCVDYVGQSFNQVARKKTQQYLRDSMRVYFEKWHRPWERAVIALAWSFIGLVTWIPDALKIKGRAKT